MKRLSERLLIPILTHLCEDFLKTAPNVLKSPTFRARFGILDPVDCTRQHSASLQSRVNPTEHRLRVRPLPFGQAVEDILNPLFQANQGLV